MRESWNIFGISNEEGKIWWEKEIINKTRSLIERKSTVFRIDIRIYIYVSIEATSWLKWDDINRLLYRNFISINRRENVVCFREKFTHFHRRRSP